MVFYGNRGGERGWEINYIMPVSKGGTDNLSNLSPIQWESNALVRMTVFTVKERHSEYIIQKCNMVYLCLVPMKVRTLKSNYHSDTMVVVFFIISKGLKFHVLYLSPQ